MQREHFLSRLKSARDALDELIEEIGEESDPRLAEAAAYAMLPEVYARLNLAWHSRDLDEAALARVPQQQLQGFPEELAP